MSAPVTTGPATVRFGQGRGREGTDGGRGRAFWLREPGAGEIRTVPLPDPGPGEVLVRTRFSGVSRGTETLVFRGEVPPDQYATMRAPFQEGDFPAPVKYGYLNVGVVAAGPAELLGRTVFCLYPHQTGYVVPAGAVVPVPDGVPAERAVLAGTVETAVNALWDARPLIGDRVTVVGAGHGRLLRGRAAGPVPRRGGAAGRRRPGRAAVGEALGVDFAAPADAAAGPGPRRARQRHRPPACSGRWSCSRRRARVVELSWYGDREVSLALGGAFHSGRLTDPQQPGRHRRPAGPDATRERLALALELLRDPPFDALITGESPFDELPAVLAGLASGDAPGALPPRRPTEGEPVFSVTVRDHIMIAHSFRGEVFGPAQRLHGATFVVDATFRRPELDATTSSSTSARRPPELGAVLGELNYRNLDDEPAFAGMNTTTEAAGPGRSPTGWPSGCGPARSAPTARGLTGITVTLHESHVAWATYERDL